MAIEVVLIASDAISCEVKWCAKAVSVQSVNVQSVSELLGAYLINITFLINSPHYFRCVEIYVSDHFKHNSFAGRDYYFMCIFNEHLNSINAIMYTKGYILV